jgi:predicted secreted protein
MGTAYAADDKAYQCQKPGDVRTVAVHYSTGSCGVFYKKVASSTDAAKELWHYQSHADMCEVQAQQFLKKLEGFGLTCAPTTNTAAAQ